MTKTTIRLAALSAALMFGVATVLPLAATAQTQPSPAPATPAAPMTSMPHKHMHHHRHHHHPGSAMVKSAQEALNKEGAALAADGILGPKTHAALKSYQQAHGLKATGRLDKATRAALKL
ncbi:MAG TPA: peptidoglycan-binding domain-containing protein [Alphaproteobacteria bacterium]|nr:peptidoglycan-binding domain-containing protein [Alphaproteobacteria bacterium]